MTPARDALVVRRDGWAPSSTALQLPCSPSDGEAPGRDSFIGCVVGMVVVGWELNSPWCEDYPLLGGDCIHWGGGDYANRG
jgi:hypothetical protein